jgi:hypothetical protein
MRRILVVTDDATLAEAMEPFRPTMALIDVDLGGGPNGYEVAGQLRAMLGGCEAGDGR